MQSLDAVANLNIDRVIRPYRIEAVRRGAFVNIMQTSRRSTDVIRPVL
jgi:hypothetical protein